MSAPVSVLPPSSWITRFAHLPPDGGSVLDLACGSGRHARWLAARGLAVMAVDRDAGACARPGTKSSPPAPSTAAPTPSWT